MAINATLISAVSTAVGAGAMAYSALNKPKPPKPLQEAKTPNSPMYGRSKGSGAPKGAIASLLGSDGSGGLAKSTLLGE